MLCAARCLRQEASPKNFRQIMKLLSELSERKKENREPDVISNVTSPWMWCLLAGFTICMVAVVYWGFFGTLVDSISGSGIVVRSRGISSITAKSTGTIEYLDVKPGSAIVPSQIIGRIYDPEVFYNIHKLQAEQEELEERTRKIQLGTDELFKKRSQADKRKNELIENLVALMKENKSRIEELVEMQQKLSSKGITSKVEHYSVLSENVSNENSLASLLMTQLQQLYEQQQASWTVEENHIRLQSELFAKKQEVELAVKSNQERIWLRSDVAGTVLELLKHTGDPVSAGECIATVSAGSGSDRNVRLVAYVSAADGKKVHPGMSVYFSPSALRAADYGYIKGIVAAVSLFPVSYESINAELKNSGFARDMASNGSVMRVEVDFVPSDKTQSGLQWTSRRGAPATVETGMVGTLLINTEYRRPISYVIPYLRETIFGVGKEGAS